MTVDNRRRAVGCTFVTSWKDKLVEVQEGIGWNSSYYRLINNDYKLNESNLIYIGVSIKEHVKMWMFPKFISLKVIWGEVSTIEQFLII